MDKPNPLLSSNDVVFAGDGASQVRFQCASRVAEAYVIGNCSANSLRDLVEKSQAEVLYFSGLLDRLNHKGQIFEGWHIDEPQIDKKSATVTCDLYISMQNEENRILTYVQSIKCEFLISLEENTWTLNGFCLAKTNHELD